MTRSPPFCHPAHLHVPIFIRRCRHVDQAGTRPRLIRVCGRRCRERQRLDQWLASSRAVDGAPRREPREATATNLRWATARDTTLWHWNNKKQTEFQRCTVTSLGSLQFNRPILYRVYNSLLGFQWYQKISAEILQLTISSHRIILAHNPTSPFHLSADEGSATNLSSASASHIIRLKPSPA